MTILINNPVFATVVFSIILAFAILISARRRKDSGGLSPAVTQELKAIAILLVVFSHVTYYLTIDHQFLWPLCIAAGVGVNLFLFLSGYGLTVSTCKSTGSAIKECPRRLGKLYIPMWATLLVLALLDFFLLHKTYPWDYLLRSGGGLFLHANLYEDINSPLWYFTLILFYYLIFPLLFSKKRPWLSALGIYALSFFAVVFAPPFFNNVSYLYKVHLVAFPLGMIFAYFFAKPAVANFFTKLQEPKKWPLRWLVVIVGSILAVYFASHGDIGLKTEEMISTITVLSLIAVFSFKRISFPTLYWIGFFSYEIYLLHWPIMYRYDFLFKYVRPCLAMLLYLVIFMGLGWCLQLLTKKLTGRHPRASIK